MINSRLFKRCCNILCLLAILTLQKPTLYAAESLSETLATQITANLPTNLSVGISPDQSPFHFIDEQGQLQGLLIDYWQLWAQTSKVSLQFVNTKSTSLSAQANNSTAKIDLTSAIVPIQQIDDTEPNLQNSLVIDLKINVSKNLTAVNDISQLSPYAVGVLANSYQHQLLVNYHPELTLKLFTQVQNLYQAALDEEIFAFVDLAVQRQEFQHHLALNSLFPAFKQVVYQSVLNQIVINNKALSGDAFNQAWLLPEQSKASLKEKWLGVKAPREQIVVAFNEFMPPYITRNKDILDGFSVAIWQLWEQYNNVEVMMVQVAQNTITNKLKNEEVDVHLSFDSSTLADNLTVIYPLYESRLQFFISADLPNIKHINDLNKKNIAIQANAPYLNKFLTTYRDIEFHVYNDLNDALMPSNKDKLDGFIAEYHIGTSLLESAKLNQLFYRLTDKLETINLSLMASKNKPQFSEMLIDGFKNIPIKALVDLEKQWLKNPKGDLSFFEQKSLRIALNNKQKKWLVNNPEIRVGMVSNWSPMETVDQFGNFNGINPDFFKLVEQRIGIKFKYIAFNDWKALLQAAKDNQVDVITSTADTPERRRFLNFSDSYWNMPWGLLHPVTGGKKAVLKDFYNKKVAMLSGLHLVQIIKESHPKIEIIEADSLDDAYQLLQQGAVSAMISSLAPASELLKRESLITMGLSVVDNIAEDTEQIAIRKDWPELLSIVNKALNSITELEKKAILDKWFNIEITTGFEKNIVIKLAIQIGVFTLIVIGVIIFWNRRLYFEIKRRKVLEDKMKHMATHDELTGLANRTLLTERINSAINFHKRQSLSLAVLFIDLDGFKHINDNYGHDVGDELLVQLTERLQKCVRESDTVARFGGDEFVLLLTGLHDKKEAAFIAEKALKVIRKPVELSAATVAVSCSIGISAFPSDGDTDTELLKVADTLMYRVKAHGKNHYLFN
ncbi:MAG: diguanylate cyclase domain-containing protein [Thalassotalea sp.]